MTLGNGKTEGDWRTWRSGAILNSTSQESHRSTYVSLNDVWSESVVVDVCRVRAIVMAHPPLQSTARTSPTKSTYRVRWRQLWTGRKLCRWCPCVLEQSSWCRKELHPDKCSYDGTLSLQLSRPSLVLSRKNLTWPLSTFCIPHHIIYILRGLMTRTFLSQYNSPLMLSAYLMASSNTMINLPGLSNWKAFEILPRDLWTNSRLSWRSSYGIFQKGGGRVYILELTSKGHASTLTWPWWSNCFGRQSWRESWPPKLRDQKLCWRWYSALSSSVFD